MDLRYASALLLGMLCGASLLRPGGAPAADPSPGEQALKAAFIYNFTKFVEWPAKAFSSPEAPFVIGVLGADPFGKLLDAAVQGKLVNGRSIVVKRFESLKALEPAHILFISSSEASSLAEALKAIQGAPVLAVSDIPRFANQGGAIGFAPEERKLKLYINLESARAAGLKISAQLLKVAKQVPREEEARR